MKKLITICLIMAATFAANAQKKELNKEETLAYMNKIGCNDYLLNFSLNANILTIKFDSSKNPTDQIELDPYGEVSIIKKDDTYWIKYNNKTITALGIYSVAQRFQNATKHLLELLKNDKSDPFGN